MKAQDMGIQHQEDSISLSINSMSRLVFISIFVCLFVTKSLGQDIKLTCSGVVVMGSYASVNDSIVVFEVEIKNNSNQPVFIPQRIKGYFFGQSCFINIGSILSKPNGINNAGVIELKRLPCGEDEKYTFEVNTGTLKNVKDILVGLDFIKESLLPNKTKKEIVSIEAKHYYENYVYATTVYSY